MCKQRVIASWESACEDCWRKVVEHDLCPMCHGKKTVSETNDNGGFTLQRKCLNCDGTGYTGHRRESMIRLNYVREILRECGIDFLELDKVWQKRKKWQK